MIKSIFYKLAMSALFIFVLSTVITIWAMLDVSFSNRAFEYVIAWFIISVVCASLVIPHIVDLNKQVK